MSKHRDLGWLAALAAGGVMMVLSDGCSTLADDCVEGRCWEGEGGSGASTSSGSGGGGQGGGGQGGGGQGGGGQGGQGGGVTGACADGSVDPGEICFTEPFDTYDTGGVGAVDMVLSDCDLDGDLDVIVLNDVSRTFTVLRNDGNGVLSADTPWSNGLDTPARFTLAETDGTPGDELYAAGNTVGFGPAIIQFDINDDCTFSMAQMYTASVPPTDVVALPFAGDGLDDPVALAFVTNPSQAGKISFVDDGTVSTNCTVVDLGTPTPAGMTVGQFGGSTVPDIAYVDRTAGLAFIRINSGSGFGNPVTFAIPGGPIAIAAGNIDGDSDVDLAVVTFDSNLVHTLRNNAGTFSVDPDPIIINGGVVAAEQPRDLQLVDIDQDGDLDIITANSGDSSGRSSVSLFINDGAGSFEPATAAQFGNLVGADFPIEVGRAPWTVRVADLNDDGLLDIITSSAFDDGGTSQVSVLLAQP